MDLCFVVVNQNFKEEDIKLFFDEPDKNWDGKVFRLTTENDMFDVLVLAGIFKSKSDAKRNWKKTGKEIPAGFSDFIGVGKLRHSIFIWNPIEIDND
jgi:hypothetical protein